MRRAYAAILFLLFVFSAVVTANTLPKSWEFWPWDWGATADVSRDTEIKYDGESSLVIQNATGAVRVVLQNVDIDASTDLTFRGWVRTDLGAQSAHLTIMFFDLAGNYLFEKQSPAVSGKAEWQQITVELSQRELQGASMATLACEVQGANTKGGCAAWFDALRLEKLSPYRRVKISNGDFEEWDLNKKGTLLTQKAPVIKQRITISTILQYTPEFKWQNYDKLRLYYSGTYGDKWNCWIQLHGNETSTNFYNERNQRPNLQVRTFDFKTRTTYKNQNLDFRFGRTILDYCPYVLRLTDDLAGRWTIRNGATLSGFQWGDHKLDTYMFFSGSSQVAVGGRYRYQTNNLKLTSVLYENHRQTGDLLERDFSHSINYKFKNADAITFDYAQQKVVDGKEADLKFLKYEGKLLDFGYNLKYYSFAPDFDPPYRNRQPLYHAEAGTITSWNPVERYQGKDGFGLEVSRRANQFGVRAEVDLWQEQEDQKNRLFTEVNGQLWDLRLTGSVLAKAQKTTNFYDTEVYVRDYLRWGCNVAKDVRTPIPMTLGYTFERENYRGEMFDLHDFYGTFRIGSGPFRGLSLKTGMQNLKQEGIGTRGYVEGNWWLPNQIRLTMRYYTKDKYDPDTYFDPISERRYTCDNLLYITFSTTFN
jgi:hypothetical protein